MFLVSNRLISQKHCADSAPAGEKKKWVTGTGRSNLGRSFGTWKLGHSQNCFTIRLEEIQREGRHCNMLKKKDLNKEELNDENGLIFS